MKFSAIKNQKGFSLVELMIVVGIIGILATLALPRFKQFQAKAKMGEAKNILSHIYTLQQTYSLDNNTFVDITPPMGANPGSLTANQNCLDGTIPNGAQQIGFRIDPCLATAPVPRYAYSAVGTPSVFVAAAVTGDDQTNRVCPGNPQHHYAINEANIIWGNTGAAPTAFPGGNPAEPNVGTVCGK